MTKREQRKGIFTPVIIAQMIITLIVTTEFVWLCLIAWDRHLAMDMHIGKNGGYTESERQMANFVADHLHTRAETYAYWKDQERKWKAREKIHRPNVFDENYREEMKGLYHATEAK